MSMTRRRLLHVAALGAIGAAAAPAVWALLGRPDNGSGPPSMTYGRDRCDNCGMIISDPRYAAASRRGDATHRFDDIGCLMVHSGTALAARQADGYVHDAETHEWLEAGAAAYVKSAALQTPMGFGIAAFATPGAARRAHPGAPVLSAADLMRVVAKEPS